MRFIEGLYIRILWIQYATRLSPTPGLCPPKCSEGHTYKWPCRARIRPVKKIKGYHGAFPPIYDETEHWSG